MKSGWITTGPKNHELEQQFCDTFGCQHAVALCSATAGMHVTLMALGIGPGDEVILPTPWYFNHKMWLDMQGVKTVPLPAGPGLIPVAEDAAKLITDRTRAIVPVHYAGVGCDMEALRAIAAPRGIAQVRCAPVRGSSRQLRARCAIRCWKTATSKRPSPPTPCVSWPNACILAAPSALSKPVRASSWPPPASTTTRPLSSK